MIGLTRWVWPGLVGLLVPLLLMLPGCPSERPESASARSPASRPAIIPAYRGHDIIGLDKAQLGKRAIELLLRNGMVVCGPDWWDIHHLYTTDELMSPAGREQMRQRLDQLLDTPGPRDFEGVVREEIQRHCLPPLVTTDAVLEAYHCLMVDSLRAVETRQAGALARWLDDLLGKRWTLQDSVLLTPQEDPRLVGLLAVACLLLDEGKRIEEVPTWVDQEFKRVRESAGLHFSPAWQREIDYSVFTPRGIYEDDETLRRYFRARTWLSCCALRVDNSQEFRIALQLAEMVEPSDTRRLVAPARAMLGPAEDPDLCDLCSVVRDMHPRREDEDSGRPFRWTHKDRQAAIERLKKQFRPRISTGHTARTWAHPPALVGVYILAPSAVPDSILFTWTTSEQLNSRLASGLDLFAALGSPAAGDLLLAQTPPSLVAPLRKALDKGSALFQQEKLSAASSACLYQSFQALAQPNLTPQHPPFMHTQAYERKSLQTALAGWARHRARWVLHAKQSAGLFGEEVSLEMPPGFVEPNLPFWDRLLETATITRQAIRPFLEEEAPGWRDLTYILLMCSRIARRQLAQEPATATEREFFLSFHQRLKDLCDTSGVGMVADIHREVYHQKVVHVGVGPARAIYVIYPYRGRNWLAQGGVTTYREYVTDGGRVLSNQDWLARIDRIAPPSWTTTFTLPPARSGITDPQGGEEERSPE